MASTASGSEPAAAREAWELIGKLFWQTRPRMLAIAGEFGLTPPQMFALRALDPDSPVSMRELAVQLHCDSSNVTGLVDGLEAHGLVERQAAEHDRRVRLLVVTERGEQVRERINEVMQQVPAPIASLSAADQRSLRDILRRALG